MEGKKDKAEQDKTVKKSVKNLKLILKGQLKGKLYLYKNFLKDCVSLVWCEKCCLIKLMSFCTLTYDASLLLCVFG